MQVFQQEVTEKTLLDWGPWIPEEIQVPLFTAQPLGIQALAQQVTRRAAFTSLSRAMPLPG